MSENPQPRATAADIEIVERGKRANKPGDLGVVVPSEVRVNGHPVLTPKGYPVTVHEIEVGGEPDAVQVTLTLLARRVSVGYEPVTED